MYKKKIFIFLPDGIGLRNFAFTNFHKIGLEKNFDIFFWNNTPFDITDLGYNEIKINDAKSHPLTDIYKRAKTQIELNLNAKRANDPIYNGYRFKFKKNSTSHFLKYCFVKTLILLYNSEKGLKKIRTKIGKLERKTKLYHDSLQTLKKEKPDLIFSTNQRVMLGVAPILAAQDLGIPTATFIFSWDNLPKASKIIEADYYFVWSQFMKEQLRYYYPHINENQIIVTGTTQFEPHFDVSIFQTKETFFLENQLDIAKKYICFSGDDVTTSPNDPVYLEDTAKAILKLNQNGHNLSIVFRRCPVDFSSRFDTVLEKYKSVITPISPKWINIDESWNTILPTKEDLELQVNTILHTEFVINLGSSMVFDYVSHNKTCCYINYDVSNSVLPNWSVKKIYKYIHFRSMPNKEVVHWINSPDEIYNCIDTIITNNSFQEIENAKKWFKKINQHPPEKASERIWNAIAKIINKNE
ncbi:UDP-glycosyltransferase [Flavobacterium sp.]|uniref:UDP-glycosyltransferase n=1 Tax=Flavobacterium sp. TaxID=239 RepID=UPI002C03D2F7|nr:UDP-glycosyltransferase [Flavobacterium sp.]HQA73642.1 UDP-glycosyltransferase [Flavobacterium sp.]